MPEIPQPGGNNLLPHYLDPCQSCKREAPKGTCPKAQRRCGHHCDHYWTHNRCCWCTKESA